ncbi:MAG: mechanosensitive ion channel protein MscS [Micavibrio aeruginosavorus]|uniref:Mechanosensitive ion channel protein MscS n=1 Tax=Micavibrio aeruginosavorus TaxID=349221 RepID=A0A2W5N1F6_9BACT|nr:MAG: mechanosensitive ion channel protein MscS [Micavibrio aeruginosavorus]
MKKMRPLYFLFFLLAAFTPLILHSASANATAAIVKGTGDKGADAATAETAPIDELGRSTPRGTVDGFLKALREEDFEKASQYLDLQKIPSSSRAGKGTELAKDFQLLLDQGGWFFPLSMISDTAEGKKDEEGIEDGYERVGNLSRDGKSIDITAQQLSVGTDKALIWLISSQTLDQLKGLTDTLGESEPLINKILPNALIEKKWFGAPAGHWMAIIFIMAFSYIFCWFLVLSLFGVIKKYWTQKCSISGKHFLDAVRVPLSLYAAVWLFAYSSLWIGLSLIVRQQMSQLNVIVAWSAIALLAWRLIDIAAEAVQNRFISTGRFFGVSSILFFFRRLVKIVFGTVIVFIVLDNLGVDVTAGLAALGIGGIALALGAQKTLENFIGSLAIVIDQPLHIGDFCKIGDVSGTVEDIGMRSTRLRTNERTLVTIPNGDLSNQRIENLARRNRFLVSKKFQLRYDGTSEQIRLFSKKMQDMLFASEHVNEEGFPVRYHGPGPDGHQMELFFYINVSDNNEYLKIQQELMLQMSDLISELGLYYIIPSQTMLPAVDQRGSEANAAAAPVPPYTQV